MPSLKFASEAEWHALRELHVGGSEIACLFNQWLTPDRDTILLHAFEAPPEGSVFLECLSPYSSSFRLWQEKAGRVKPSFEESERMRAGKHLEPALAAWAQEVWPEWKLRKTRRYLRHDTNAGWGCSLDYEVVGEGYPPVEFKNVDFLIYRDKWCGGDAKADPVPPVHINLQLQAQIGVSKADHGWIVVCVGGNRLERVRVERHEPTQELIDEAVAMFWQAVKAGAEPAWLAEYDTVKTMFLDHPTKDVVDLSADEAACRDVSRYARWKRHAEFVDTQLDMMKARVAMKIGDGTKAATDRHTITFPVVSRAAKMIPEKWQTEASWRGGFTVKPKKD